MMGASRRAKSPGPGTYDRSLGPRERRRVQHGQLLLAAVEVFAKRGFAGASVEAIIDLAGMSRRTFYEHFDGLSDVLKEVHARSAKIALAAVAGAMGDVADPIARIEAGIAAFLSLAGANAGLARVLFREVRSAGPQYERRREELLEEFGAMLAAALRDAYAAGRIARAPDDLTVFAVTAAVEAVALRFVERGEEGRIAEALPVLTRVVLQAF